MLLQVKKQINQRLKKKKKWFDERLSIVEENKKYIHQVKKLINYQIRILTVR